MSCDFRTISKGKRRNPKNPIVKAFGSLRNGIDGSSHEYVEDPCDADLVFVFGSVTRRKEGTDRARAILGHRRDKRHIASLDIGFLKKDSNVFRVGYGDCTGEGRFLFEPRPSRVKIFGVSLKEVVRRDPGLPILILLQSERGWTYDDPLSMDEWLRRTIEDIGDDREILLKPHPTSQQSLCCGDYGSNVRILPVDPKRKNMSSVLADVGAVITHSSSGVIESLIEGIPSFSLSPRCVAHRYTCHDLAMLGNLENYDFGNRQKMIEDWAANTHHVTEFNTEWVERFWLEIQNKKNNH
ncbi:MAG: hypothetical protein JAZ07_00715 [Candidatus Thiodiazotropha endolucinida]|uniref:Capsule polysaccharide biosynthesis protein n=1 Tax=Candidatus Thiodiazotropha taylori TaxID=2792791 RepID=A0A9E4KA16_9GAMM|nr:hypothetical protein [Candidatus Thiodiazotropha taylori]